MARHQPGSTGRVPPFVYHAEVFDDEDRHTSSIWACEHEHPAANQAYECGLEWLKRAKRLLKTDLESRHDFA